MKTISMNEKLLSIICMVQAAKALFVNEISLVDYGSKIENAAYTDRMRSDKDWLQRTENYYYSMSNELIDEVELKKNTYCFRAIIDFQVTDEMLNTKPNKLDQFWFSY